VPGPALGHFSTALLTTQKLQRLQTRVRDIDASQQSRTVQTRTAASAASCLDWNGQGQTCTYRQSWTILLNYGISRGRELKAHNGALGNDSLPAVFGAKPRVGCLEDKLLINWTEPFCILHMQIFEVKQVRLYSRKVKVNWPSDSQVNLYTHQQTRFSWIHISETLYGTWINAWLSDWIRGYLNDRVRDK